MDVIFCMDIPTLTLQNTDMDVVFFGAATDMDVAEYRHGRYFLGRNPLVIKGSASPKEKVNMLYQEKHHHGANCKLLLAPDRSDDACEVLMEGRLA